MNKLTTFIIVTTIAFSSFQLKANGEKENYEIRKDSIINSLAQNEKGNEKSIKGKVLVTGSAGLNYFDQSLVIKYDVGTFDILNLSDFISNLIGGIVSSPLLNVGIDYGIKDKVSLGVSFGYQKVTIERSDRDMIYNLTGSYPQTYTDQLNDDTWRRFQFAVRSDYYIIANKLMILYSGLKIGYNHYKVTTTMTEPPPNYSNAILLQMKPSRIAIQPHLGFNYYLRGIVGLSTEVGISYGGPYNAAVGLTIKI